MRKTANNVKRISPQSISDINSFGDYATIPVDIQKYLREKGGNVYTKPPPNLEKEL